MLTLVRFSLALVFATSVVLADDRVSAPDKAWWDVTPDPIRPAQYEGIDRRSYYVTMRDGTRLAVDVHLPAGLVPGTKLPTILEQTRYYRSVALRPESGGGCKPRVGSTLGFFVPRGYAYVVVDVRGSGPSLIVPSMPANTHQARQLLAHAPSTTTAMVHCCGRRLRSMQRTLTSRPYCSM